MFAAFVDIRAAVEDVGRHKAALMRLYRAHRPEFANAGKIDELWEKCKGPELWLLLCAKYTTPTVAGFAKDLKFPAEDPRYQELKNAASAALGADDM